MGDYPSDAELAKVKFIGSHVPIDAEAMLEHLKSIWWAPDWGFHLRVGRTRHFRHKCQKLELHTGGWSGNEYIIGELQGTMFWHLYWTRTDRGGHYYFEIEKPRKN